MSQLEPGHRPPTAPTPPPPRREAINELKPAATFRIPAGRIQLGHPRPAAISDLDTDNSVPRLNRDRDRLARSGRPAVPDAVAKQLAHQQGSDISARVPGAKHPAHEHAGNSRPLRPPSKRRGLPDRRSSHQRTRLPGRPRPGNRTGPQGGHRDARPTQRRTSSRTPAVPAFIHDEPASHYSNAKDDPRKVAKVR
jgi:hypothetical protein